MLLAVSGSEVIQGRQFVGARAEPRGHYAPTYTARSLKYISPSA